MPQTYQEKKESRLLRGLGTPNQGRKDSRYRPGDRHKAASSKRHKSGKVLSKWERRYVVAWDGEGANLNDGTHVYNLLANSDGAHLLNHEGLGTRQVFDFFLKYSDPRAINVIFGGSYDCNMLLVDVPKPLLLALWMQGRTRWHEYEIFYTNRKKFTVKKWAIRNGKPTSVSFVLWDVIGYFQSTFAVACRKWLGDLPILDDIERMKLQRNVFTVDKIEDIIAYNKQECDLLVQLMEALFEALDECDIKLRRYDGAGSIAAALLKKNSIMAHKGDVPTDVYQYAQVAYSGGRIEAPKIGTYDGHIYRNDINSAYPSIMVNLPSYREATWTLDNEWDGSDNSMVHVEWHIKKKELFYPLWYREYDGTILYPQHGEGIYWGSEVRNLVDFYDPSEYEIIEAYNVHLKYQYHPFHFVQKVYNQRLDFKAIEKAMGLKAGASEALKLGINSLYGKTAQQNGARLGQDGKWQLPTYHQLLWAGQITAGARAQLYRAARQVPNSVIAFATDALITTEPINVEVGEGLGQWTFDEFEGITIMQPGVYFLKGTDDYKEKYRGFDKGSLSREHIIGSWVLGMDYEASLTRFVSLGAALASTKFEDVWRTWKTDKRRLGITPSGKRTPSNDVEYWDHLCDTLPTHNLNLDKCSEPYPIIWSVGYHKIKPQVDNVDMDEIDRDYLDSFA